jgi:YD repeat-containing protein
MVARGGRTRGTGGRTVSVNTGTTLNGLTDADGDATFYNYDGSGDRTAQTDADGGAWARKSVTLSATHGPA